VNRSRRVLVGLAVTVGLLAATTQAWAASWTIQTTPNPSTTENVFRAVTSTSPTNAWAVGAYFPGATSQTLIEHYDGSTWTQVSSPNVGTDADNLYGVRATSPTNAWAVGTDAGPSFFRGLVEHYDGTSWSIQPSAGGDDEFLYGVGATSSTNAWAVGGSGGGSYSEHYDGTSWKSVSVPGTNGQLYGVTLPTSSGAWAVGAQSSAPSKTLIVHYNGTKWKLVTSPNPSTTDNALTGVSNNSPSDIWAVGYWGNNKGAERTLILHYDGTSWTKVSSPNRGSTSNILNSVKAVSSTDVWAVGASGYNTGTSRTLIEHWDGTSWTIQPSPNAGILNNDLFGVASSSATNSFAVGFSNGAAPQTLAMHCSC
jgi:hypothetical protein